MGIPAAQLHKDIKFTYADYLLYPTNGNQCQLIEGEFYMTPAPKTYHQDISRNLEFILHSHVAKHDLGKIYDAPTDVVFSDANAVQPDIFFISKKRIHIIKENCIKGAPDLIVEILSPKSKTLDLKLKRVLYAKHGVKEYWIVDPGAKKVDVLVLLEKGYTVSATYKTGQILVSKLFPGLKLRVSDVFKK